MGHTFEVIFLSSDDEDMGDGNKEEDSLEMWTLSDMEKENGKENDFSKKGHSELGTGASGSAAKDGKNDLLRKASIPFDANLNEHFRSDRNSFENREADNVSGLQGEVQNVASDFASEPKGSRSLSEAESDGGLPKGYRADWEALICDLCGKGPSLISGMWYSSCCGRPRLLCSCNIKKKRVAKRRKSGAYLRSGVVHRMCALWSSACYLDQDGQSFAGLQKEVSRGSRLACASCNKKGATLGCKVINCRRSYHYPCAVRDFLHMSDGVNSPVRCKGHFHVAEDCASTPEIFTEPKHIREQLRQNKTPRHSTQQFQIFKSGEITDYVSKDGSSHGVLNRQGRSKSKETQPLGRMRRRSQDEEHLTTKSEVSSVKQLYETTILNNSPPSRDVEFKSMAQTLRIRAGQTIKQVTRMVECSQETLDGWKGRRQVDSREDPVVPTVVLNGDWKEDKKAFHMEEEKIEYVTYLGKNLVCLDLSQGKEQVPIPVTNDEDNDPPPDIEYIIENRYMGPHPGTIWSLAPPCKGCCKDLDDPNDIISHHVLHNLTDVEGSQLNDLRLSDKMEDWQGENMYGRLPYDSQGRLQLAELQDIVECNDRCPCGTECRNRQLQNGLQIRLEVFKTRLKGWGVRSLQRIYRGQFVVPYVGEVLDEAEARRRGEEQDKKRLSCLFNVDAPGVAEEDVLVIDGYTATNVGRFINHSCDGNLAAFRVYVDTLEAPHARLGMFARRDIEVGTELVYNYGYNIPEEVKDGHQLSIPCLCGAEKCQKMLWAQLPDTV